MDPYKMPILETERLILRPVSIHDVDAMFDYASRPEVAYYTLFKPHESVHETRNIIETLFLARPSKQVPEAFAIVIKETGQMVGTCDFWPTKGVKTYEMGYALHPDFWGKGYVTEAVHQVLSFAFTRFGVRRMEIGHMADNIGSKRVIEKCGFMYEGVRRQVYQSNKDGTYQDEWTYALLKEDYDEKFRTKI